MHPLVRDTKKTDIYRDVQKNIPEENMTNLKLFFCLLGPTCPNERGGTGIPCTLHAGSPHRWLDKNPEIGCHEKVGHSKNHQTAAILRSVSCGDVKC